MAQVNDESTQSPEDAEEIVVEADEIVVEEAETSEAPTATATLTDEKVESPFGGERVIYVTAAVPPKPHSNRVVGALLAIAGAVVFAVLYGLVAAAMIALRGTGGLTIADFLTDAIFWIPVLFFTIGFVLVVLLVNRAAWWVHVLASLLVAVITYLGAVGMLLLVTGIVGASPGFVATATNPFVIAAAVVAREVSIWVGLLISRRGSRLTERNRAEREAFEAEQAGKASDGASAARA
jgi:hypothetical protein